MNSVIVNNETLHSSKAGLLFLLDYYYTEGNEEFKEMFHSYNWDFNISVEGNLEEIKVSWDKDMPRKILTQIAEVDKPEMAME